MNSSSTELKVGLFAIIVIVFLTYMTFKVGSLPLIWEKGYRLYVDFNDISGLDEKSKIKIAGVEAGIVEKIELSGGRAKLTLLMSPEIKLYRDARAYLKMSGLLGDRYLSLSIGSPDEPVLDYGDTITNVVPAVDIGMLANQLTSASVQLNQLTKNLNSILGESQIEDIKDTIHNLKGITADLKDLSHENRVPLNRIIAQLENFTKSLSEQGPGFMDDMGRIADNLGDKGPGIISNLDSAVRELKELLEENRFAFTESMENIRSVSRSANNIARKMEGGEGTLGKLVTDDSLYTSLTSVSKKAEKTFDFADRLRTYLDFHSEYNLGESEWKGYFDLTLKPRNDKYYVIGIVSDPIGSVKTTETTTNGSTVIEHEVTSRIEFSAQFVKRFNELALRIGVIENTFGFGADYFFSSGDGRIKLDMWDMSAKEAGADDPHAKIGIDYRFFKYFFVSSGIDNLLNANRRGVYVGGGLNFEDEDFKYLLGSAPVSFK